MRIALTYNLKRSTAEAEAEFDTASTIATLARILSSLGHAVTTVEVSCAIDSLVRRLRKLAPDLVFNLAEGSHGRFREAFYPALFEQLGLAHTGSHAGVLAVCLDKVLAKRLVAAAGVATPPGRLVRSLGDLDGGDDPLPLIAKPNFEGSSKGITQASVITDRRGLRATIASLLARYPDGVLLERYVDGVDVSVGWIAGIPLLAPIGYAYEPSGPHRILDLALKQGPPELVRVEIPAAIDAATTRALMASAERAFAALGIEGYGRADFRITPAGAVEFLEMNPLPSLAPGDDELYAAAAHAGRTPCDLIAAIVAAACPVIPGAARVAG